MVHEQQKIKKKKENQTKIQYRLDFRAFLLKIKICQNKKAFKFVGTNHLNKFL